MIRTITKIPNRAYSIFERVANFLKVQLTQQQQPVFNSNKKYYRNNYYDDFDLYDETFSYKNEKSHYSKSTNHGKRWTDEEEDEAAELFYDGVSIKDIAKHLARGVNGVRMKLMNVGLMEE